MQKIVCYCDLCKLKIGSVQESCKVELKGIKSHVMNLEVCNSCYVRVREFVKSLQSTKLPE